MEFLHGDETPCQILHEKGREATTKSYIWLIIIGNDGLEPIIPYHYFPSRGHEVAEGLLGDFKSYFHTDKYDGYNCLEDHVIRCLCWTHGRHKWYDTIPASLKNRDRSRIKDLNDLTMAEIGFTKREQTGKSSQLLCGYPPGIQKLPERWEVFRFK